MGNNGNLFNESIKKMEERAKYYFNLSENTEIKRISDQYLAHAEYWRGVSQKMRC